MAVMADTDRQRLLAYLAQAMDESNAADLESFARNFLHSAAIWDLLADHFPDAAPSAIRAVMMEAFNARQPKE
jgi:hypothetical protein